MLKSMLRVWGRAVSSGWTTGSLIVASVAHATCAHAEGETIIESASADPQCQLKLVDGVKLSSLGTGWYRFSAVLLGDIVTPTIYLDLGEGFGEDDDARHFVERGDDSRYAASFFVPAGARLRRLRFDPSTAPGKYVVRSATLSRVPPDRGATSSGEASHHPTSYALPGFDADYYLRTNPDVGAAKKDPVEHFLFTGHLESRNPSPGFDTSYYRSRYMEIDSDENPLVHYNRIGRQLGYHTMPGVSDLNIANEVAKNVRRSEHFEPADPAILRPSPAKVFAFYLPQFHQIPENDSWWGNGFTEWTNIVRGLPRYKGQYQPRIPADLGFYDLTDPRSIIKQAKLAKSMGISGFVFYHYSFNRTRLLRAPLDLALKNSQFDMPFALLWANENWTRTWDGGESEILIAQDYRTEDQAALVADLASYMDDRRYILIDGRPLFIIYRPSIIPNAHKYIKEIRRLFKANHGIEPLIFMAQFDAYDPREYDLDGAIEFPPHKISCDLRTFDRELTILDDGFCGRVYSYSEAVDVALNEPDPEFDLIKTVFPMWDNDARRQRHSTSFAGSTPKEYGRWLRGAIAYALRRPVRSQSIVCVNAWNEWAEGAYLEPDVHYGGAYLNATARALSFVPTNKPGMLLVGHDAHDHGAQRLLLNIATRMRRKLGVNLEILLLGPGTLTPAYEAVAPTAVLVDEESFRAFIVRKRTEGFDVAICNTTPGGRYVKLLKDCNFRTISLIHELPTLLENYRLSETAVAISRYADACVFPSRLVRHGFESFTESRIGNAVIRPQGLYDDISAGGDVRRDVRKELGIPVDSQIVVNAAYGDLRKGFDLFRQVAQRFESSDLKVCFVWVGAVERELRSWLVDHAPKSGRAANFLAVGFRNDLGRILLASDVFLLTSREDPFPTVMIDALAAGLPIVAMQEGGGFIELFEHGFVGSLSRFNDVDNLCELVRCYLALPPDTRAGEAELRRELIEREFNFDTYVLELLRLGGLVGRSVSVIVPNYNYAAYLRQRLSGIFNQTYPILEIIVLDDASTDDSIAVLDQVEAEFDREIIRIANVENSRSVFRQWRKGVERAGGDLIWIAEADDDARPDFLFQLARFFNNGRTIFAFSESSAIDEDGKKLSDDYRFYYSSFDEDILANEETIDAKEFVVDHLAVRNCILNVSSVLWDRGCLEKVLAKAAASAEEYKLAGDWRIYLEACLLDGEIAFTPEPLNIHRRHTGSVTGSTRLLDQVKEIKRIHELVLDRFPQARDAHSAMVAYRQELTERAESEVVKHEMAESSR